MANRIVGNVIIVDSAMGNLNLIESATGNYRKLSVNAVAFWAANTLGAMTLTLGNTATEQIMIFDYLNLGSGGSILENRTQHRVFSSPQSIEDVKVPVCTAGTGWIYLS